jgi:hypothetical protein
LIEPFSSLPAIGERRWLRDLCSDGEFLKAAARDETNLPGEQCTAHGAQSTVSGGWLPGSRRPDWTDFSVWALVACSHAFRDCRSVRGRDGTFPGPMTA